MNLRRDRPGEFAMRPSPEPDLRTETLDRLWAATRPAPPTPEQMDALWAGAARELDRIEAAGTAPLVLPTRRRRAVAWVALAQAAVILIAVGFALTDRGSTAPRRPEAVPTPGPALVAAHQPPEPTAEAPVAKLEVGFYEAAFVRIGSKGWHVDRLADPPAASSIPENTWHDFFNDAESMAKL